MKEFIVYIIFFYGGLILAHQDSTKVYKKKVLESTEVDFLSTYNVQDGNNASVTRVSIQSINKSATLTSS
ncbi:hypothetical protein [Winogradskyella vincentii]|uniref:Uncharacterized protein n=1 Tax=Winogradskyella vincentii TaxID=2877122 RepID=A0ABS7Y1M1_9FLAO|nr:hypothetical protein [Winogradskyella vincentii]MCA0153150.1 hypothetical protein [Winogradskyella vincentii]